MAYEIHLTRSAKRQFGRLPAEMKRRIAAAIDGLMEDPRPPGCIKLSGPENLYRLRVGDYRIIYDIQDEAVTVLVVKIGHRREVYR